MYVSESSKEGEIPFSKANGTASESSRTELGWGSQSRNPKPSAQPAGPYSAWLLPLCLHPVSASLSPCYPYTLHFSPCLAPASLPSLGNSTLVLQECDVSRFGYGQALLVRSQATCLLSSVLSPLYQLAFSASSQFLLFMMMSSLWLDSVWCGSRLGSTWSSFQPQTDITVFMSLVLNSQNRPSYLTLEYVPCCPRCSQQWGWGLWLDKIIKEPTRREGDQSCSIF